MVIFNNLWLWLAFLAAVCLALILLNWQTLLKALAAQFFRQFLQILMTDKYKENLLELYTAGRRTGFLPIMELNLRAQDGKVIKRPMGSGRPLPNFSGLMFDVAQLASLPTQPDTPVDTKTVIGPNAAKPLLLDTPIMVGGMAYGLGLSAKAKVALAKGTALAGTAINSGAGPFLQQERDNARHWIFQYNRGFWAKDPGILALADAVEIQFGQGALGGLGFFMEPQDIDRELQSAFPIPAGRKAETLAHFREIKQPADNIEFIRNIRSLTDGIPLGIKLAGGKNLESDLEIALQAGVDFISISGSQGATHGGPPAIIDHFGLPTLFALVRAVQFLEKHGVKNQVSLICDGGLSDPGEMLKALALGANAVYIGTAALFAISHTQVLHALPWEPPTQIVWYKSRFGHKYDPNLGAANLANFINACTLEMADGARALGKTALSAITSQDLFALDRQTAEITGVPLGYYPGAGLPSSWQGFETPQKPCGRHQFTVKSAKKPAALNNGYRIVTRSRPRL